MPKRKQEGITLIALVITIILLLILAGVTLKIVLDNNFVDKTQKAVDKYSEAQKNETEQIKYFLENYLGEVDNTEGKEHRTLNGAEPAYNNPIIPVGFKTSSEGASWMSSDGKTVSGWNDGLVIEDKDGNQFVWVPVDNVNVKYEKWLGSKNNASITSLEQASDDKLPSGVTSEADQITKYGGFYIGRYEAGIPESMTEAISPIPEGEEVTDEKIATKRNVLGIPVSKKNQVPWNFINSAKAKANAESMYTEEKVKSGLLTGTMWDTTCKWLENSGVKVDTDCKEWGNYSNAPVTGITEYTVNNGLSWISVNSRTKPTSGNNRSDYIWLLKTGNSEYTKRKNIYDFAGNLWEKINEVFSSNGYMVSRSGGMNYDGSCASSYRSLDAGESTTNGTGFRVALYIQ